MGDRKQAYDGHNRKPVKSSMKKLASRRRRRRSKRAYQNGGR